MAEKVTIMELKVDLQCPRCYKKIKRILYKFPRESLSLSLSLRVYVYIFSILSFYEYLHDGLFKATIKRKRTELLWFLILRTREIRDQVYNEKENTVRIIVVCCSPEKIQQKLCCKGRGVIKSIDIIEPPKPKPAPAPAPKPDPPKPAPAPKPDPPKPAPAPKPDPPKQAPAPDPPKPAPEPKPIPVLAYPPAYPNGLLGVWCMPCYYEGNVGGPCRHQHEHERPAPPRFDGCDCGCGGRRTPGYDDGGCGCGGNRFYGNRCDVYFSEENPSACTVM